MRWVTVLKKQQVIYVSGTFSRLLRLQRLILCFISADITSFFSMMTAALEEEKS